MAEARTRLAPVTILSLAVACFSLATAMYQGWLQTRNLEAVQRDIARREQIRSCRDVIEVYFEVKTRIQLLAEAAAGSAAGEAATAAAMAVGRFGAIGTFLANVQGEEARRRYTALTRELTRVLASARGGGVAEPAGLFQEADRLFQGMNDDCVTSARLVPS